MISRNITLGSLWSRPITMLHHLRRFFSQARIKRSKPCGSGNGTARILPALESLESRLNPAFTSAMEEQVSNLYRFALNREPDPSGLAAWTSSLQTGRLDLRAVADGIFHSREHLTSSVTSLYLSILGRDPDPVGLESFVNAASRGVTDTDISAAMLDSREFTEGCDDKTFVNLMYERVLNRMGDPDGIASHMIALSRGVARREVALGFFRSPEAASTTVAGLYQNLLGRQPSPWETRLWSNHLAAPEFGVKDAAVRIASSPEGASRLVNPLALASMEGEKDWWPQNLGFAGLNQALLEVTQVQQFPGSGEIRLSFNYTLDSSFNPFDNFQRVLTNGMENTVMGSIISDNTLTLKVSPFEQGVVEVEYFDKTPGTDDPETLRRLGGLDLPSFYLVAAAGYTEGFEFFVDQNRDGTLSASERTQWQILDGEGLAISGPNIDEAPPESAILPGESVRWGSNFTVTAGNQGILPASTRLFALGASAAPQRIEDNPAFHQADAMLASKFAELAYNHRKPDFASLLASTGWTGITLPQLPVLASGKPFSAVAGYGVRDGFSMQSYAMAARSSLPDGTQRFIVSFEGSNSPIDEPADWIVNASKYGWSRYYASLMPIVTEVVREMLVEQDAGRQTQLILAGHSLGGAAAMVAYADLFVAPGRDLWPATSTVLGNGDRIYNQKALAGWAPDRVRALLEDTTVYTIGAPSFLIEPTKPNGVEAAALFAGITASTGNPLVQAGILMATAFKSLTVDNSKLPDLTDYSNAVFQYAHKNSSWYLPGDIVAQLGSRHAGTQLDVNLGNDIQYRYTGFLLYAVPGGTHGSNNYRESAIRSVTGDTLLKSPNELKKTSPMLPKTLSALGAESRNDLFENLDAQGLGGNDVFWYSTPGKQGQAYNADGGKGDDLFVIKNYGVSIKIDGATQSGHDTLLISLNNSKLEASYQDTDNDGVADQAIFRIVSPEGQRFSTVTVEGWNKFQLASIARVEKREDTKWDLTYINPTSGVVYNPT